MPKHKILIVGSLPPPYSGMETAIQVLLASGLKDSFQLRLLDTRTTRNPSARGKVSLSNILSTMVVLVRLVWALVAFRSDIAYVPLAQNRTGFLKWLAFACCCKLAGCKIVSRLGGAAFDEFYKASSAVMCRTILFGLGFVDMFIVDGPTPKGQLRGLVEGERIRMLPNGFDLDGWTKSLQAIKLDDNGHNIPQKLQVLYLAHVSKAKGVLDLLEAIGRLKQEGGMGGFKFTIAGPLLDEERNILHINNPHSTKEAIRQVMGRYDLDGEITFVGEVSFEEKQRLYKKTDIFVAPSYSEGGVPYSVLEAFASDCCVVCTPVGPIKDYTKDSQEVFFVPVGSPKDIASTLLSLQDESLREQLVHASREYLCQTHGLDVFTERMKLVFNGLIMKSA